jgi:hypothetical protein
MRGPACSTCPRDASDICGNSAMNYRLIDELLIQRAIRVTREVTAAVAKSAVISGQARAQPHVLVRSALWPRRSFAPTSEFETRILTPRHVTAAGAATETQLPFWQDCLPCLAPAY